MKAMAGVAPWNRKLDSVKQYNDKGNLKSSFSVDKNTGWAIGVGYYNKSGKKRASGKKTIYDFDDKSHRVTVWEHDDSRGFHRHFTPDNASLGKAEEAFDESRVDYDPSNVYKADGCGHIIMLEYASRENILRVTFENGDVCVFFSVPHAVAGTLFHHAKTKATRGKHMHGSKMGLPRHVLGIEFWDLVRIRGQLYGTRYPFEYQEHVAGRYVDPSAHNYVARGDTVTALPLDVNDYMPAAKEYAKINEYVANEGIYRLEQMLDEAKSKAQDLAVKNYSNYHEGDTENIALLRKVINEDYPELAPFMKYPGLDATGKLLSGRGIGATVSMDTNEYVNVNSDDYREDSYVGEVQNASPYIDVPEITFDTPTAMKNAIINKIYNPGQLRSDRISMAALRDNSSAFSGYNTPQKVITVKDLKDKWYDIAVLGSKNYAKFKVYMDNNDYEGAVNFLKNTKYTKQFYNKDGTPSAREPLRQSYLPQNSVFMTDEDIENIKNN